MWGHVIMAPHYREIQNMSNAQLKLTDAELEQIEAQRAEKQAAEDKKQALRDQAKAKALRVAADRHNTIVELAQNLQAADTDGIFIFSYPADKDPLITFFVDTNEHRLDIREQFAATGRMSLRRGGSNGYKYNLNGSFGSHRDSWTNKWYKNPKTLIARVKELQEIAHARFQRAQVKETLINQAFAKAKELYPNATVTIEKGGRSYRNGSRYTSETPDRVKVATYNGSYEFTGHQRDGEIELCVWKRTIGTSIDEQVRKLVLG